MGFRENLKSELEFQDIKTKELAEMSGVNKRTIDHYLLSNPQQPSAENAVKIAQALHVSVEYLVTGKNHCPENNLSKELNNFLNQFLNLSLEQKESIIKLVELLAAK